MRLKSLATLPFAFLAGLLGRVGYRLFPHWAYAHRIGYTRALDLGVFAVFVVVPFLLCSVGVDPKRWEDHYFFSDVGKADVHRSQESNCDELKLNLADFIPSDYLSQVL
jgi:hypothetical protein